MNKPREIWKTVIHSEENMRDVMNYFMDDYIQLKDFYENKSSIDGELDDATWVHIDRVEEELEQLRQTITKLEKALAIRNSEYSELEEKYKKLQKK